MTRELLPPEKWEQLKVVFERAIRLPPDQREAAVSAASADPEVKREVLALLVTHEQTGSLLVAPETGLLEIGHRLGRYEVVTHLGGGAMGEVYRAHDTDLDRHVAVKVLRGRIGDDAGRVRFLREARAIAALSHPNVVAIHDMGEASGLLYLVTELLAGDTLRVKLQRGRPTVPEALDWTVQIAGGLAAAHMAGIVHRDLKPENVFLVAGGTVKILDFGLARSPARSFAAGDETLSMPGMIVGTAGYLAPEQARGLAVAQAADLFSLGAILFELLTGERAFRGASAADTLRAVLDHDPPAPSSLRPEVPRWLDRVVARCLAKDTRARFESASDLAFALRLPLDSAGPAAAPPSSRRRRAVWLGVVAAVALGLGAASRVLPLGDRPAATAEPARPYPLTSSGRDRHPAVSPDGRFLAFTSDRDGQPRIWLTQLDIGRESPLTEGPDSGPRFSPDGNQVLFTRTQATGSALYRVSLLGGEVTRVIDDASDGDWSPDGRQVAFVRSRSVGDRAGPALMIAQVDGSGQRELARLGDRPLRGRGEQRPRWSPDGSRIAVSGFVLHPGTPQHVLLIPVDGSPATEVPAPSRVGLVSAVAWAGTDALLYSQSFSVSGNTAGSLARIVRQRVRDGTWTTLLWTPESSFVLDRWPGRGVVYDARSSRQNLREVTRATGASRWLSLGTSTDRQPSLSPDGQSVIFASSRGSPKLDVWMVDRSSGGSRRLTDHPAEDYDPALTPDGRHLLWSSDRSGNFEVWMADADGANPRQVTRDGVDAENPTATPDGAWLTYACGAPGRAGVWRIRPDGTEALRLVPNAILPEISPDGRYVLFQMNRSPRLAVVGVASIADGRVLPFEVRIDVHRQIQVVLGRARWMPDGRAIAFVGQDEAGRTGVFTQAFALEGDTSSTRVPLVGFDPDRLTESFDVDAERVILAEWDQRSDIMAATQLPR